MGIDVLGALRIGGSATSLQRRDQVVLCALAMRPGDVLAADRLAEALWGDEPPRSWSKVVQGCVLRLRRALGVESIETTAAGYRLTVPDDEIDCRRFEEFITRGVSLAATDDFDRAIVAFGRALELWRGHPLDLLDGWSPGRIEAARLDELRRSAEERLLDARLEFGEHREVVGIAEARVAEEPLREHRWATLAVAQYRCGRQAEALRSLKRARQTLVEELGIGPGAEIVELERSILTQDDALLVTPEPPAIADHCPYKGLAPYDVEDAEGFFGRSEEVAECLQRLRVSPLLVVTGPSGCGKSSLARAGLVPALVRAGHRVAVFVPGHDPQAAMVEVLASCDLSPVLVVDQFEEAFLLTGASGDRARSFCARLEAYAVGVAPVIVTIRADHVAGLGVDLEFARLAERGLHIVTALSGEPLRQAIEGPATQAGLRIEPGLVDLLERDCEGEPGALPLLSHALAETWQRRDGRVLTVEGTERPAKSAVLSHDRPIGCTRASRRSCGRSCARCCCGSSHRRRTANRFAPESPRGRSAVTSSASGYWRSSFVPGWSPPRRTASSSPMRHSHAHGRDCARGSTKMPQGSGSSAISRLPLTAGSRSGGRSPSCIAGPASRLRWSGGPQAHPT